MPYEADLIMLAGRKSLRSSAAQPNLLEENHPVVFSNKEQQLVESFLMLNQL